ncbi:hypothetical protein [Nonomuraea aridisoli]|nr:hypothetical protein [Nonomuraea aridisoli]
MLTLLRRLRSTTITFDERRGGVCDATCRAEALVERARTSALMAR